MSSAPEEVGQLPAAEEQPDFLELANVLEPADSSDEDDEADEEQDEEDEDEEEAVEAGAPPGHAQFQELHDALGPHALLQLFFQFRHERQRSTTYAELIESLEGAGHLRSPAVKAAFVAVDRKTYCEGAEDDEECYADTPFRSTSTGVVVHLSAPSIYARAVEALELRRGHSFLNIGSGTGYLSTIVAGLIGPHAVHHGVETRPKLVEMATRLARERGLDSVQFRCGNAHHIDEEGSIKFDRIYVGAGAELQDRGPILSLLKVGGIAVGPFENDEGEQRLLKATRMADDAGAGRSAETFAREPTLAMRFKFETLMRVSFAPLQPAEAPAKAGECLVLRGPVWGADRPLCFPPTFVHVAAVLWLATMRDPDSLPAKLPWEVWALHVLPFLEHDAFEQAGGTGTGDGDCDGDGDEPCDEPCEELDHAPSEGRKAICSVPRAAPVPTAAAAEPAPPTDASPHAGPSAQAPVDIE